MLLIYTRHNITQEMQDLLFSMCLKPRGHWKCGTGKFRNRKHMECHV